MFPVLFPQELLFRDAGPSDYLFRSLIKINCPLHIIKHLYTLGNNFVNERILEKCK